MTRSLFRTTLIVLFLTPLAASPARADSWFKFGNSGKKSAPAKKASSEEGRSEIVQAGYATVSDEDCDDDSDGGSRGSLSSRLQARRDAWAQRRQMARDLAAVEPAPCYPQINSALYPCPRPDVPWEVGQTVITNQAFYPHEMLYCHRYKAIYPPFYYENKCGLACIPFFPKPCIKGTVVTVKYKTTLPCSFYPPWGSVKKCFSNTQFR
jgi:hypothetical protein